MIILFWVLFQSCNMYSSLDGKTSNISHGSDTENSRVLIWHSMIPELNDMDAKTLAAKYDFSGGQIENIARHYTIDSILHDAKEDKLAMLINHCDNERVDDNSKRRIGF